MNCDQFGERMHRCLDNRMSLDGDGELVRHARSCGPCRAQLNTWRQISAIMPSAGGECRSEPHRRFAAKSAAAIAGLAVAILVAVIAVHEHTGGKGPRFDASPTADPHHKAFAQASGDLDPTHWWRSVQDRDWVDQTMPAVRSVQKGVAPLGRSLLRAVTILTTGGREQTS